MARGEASKVKVHYKGTDEDFLVLVDSVDDYQKWLGDKSVPLAHVVSSFKVFTTHKYVFSLFLPGVFLWGCFRMVCGAIRWVDSWGVMTQWVGLDQRVFMDRVLT